MKAMFMIGVCVSACLCASGCITTVALAPGASQVRITQQANDVATCKVVGNVKAPSDAPADMEPTIRNQAVGLGGNTIFLTKDISGPQEGVAYRCP